MSIRELKPAGQPPRKLSPDADPVGGQRVKGESVPDPVARMRQLAQERFAPRAADYDRVGAFPRENFDDLFQAGLLAPCLPAASGGLHLGHAYGDVMSLWNMTKEIAKADLSMARCWEGHVNSLMLLDGMASPAQKERWFPGVVQQGQKWVAWSGEPQARAPGETSRIGTRVEPVDGGYIVDGSKVFATSAGNADWAILLVSTAGPGGARHAAGSADQLILLACDLSDATISFDDSWWDPIGMRSTVSYLVRFEKTFIPSENLIGQPGQYFTGGWQTRFIPHYAVSFLGAAEAAYEHALEYIGSQQKAADPFVQQHLGQMAINVETGQLWIEHVARMWETGAHEEAQLAGSRARHAVEHLAQDTVSRCIRACGARCLIRPSPVERIYRDLTIYLRHDNDDHILATIGKAILGQAHDASFYKP